MQAALNIFQRLAQPWRRGAVTLRTTSLGAHSESLLRTQTQTSAS